MRRERCTQTLKKGIAFARMGRGPLEVIQPSPLLTAFMVKKKKKKARWQSWVPSTVGALWIICTLRSLRLRKRPAFLAGLLFLRVRLFFDGARNLDSLASLPVSSPLGYPPKALGNSRDAPLNDRSKLRRPPKKGLVAVFHTLRPCGHYLQPSEFSF